jgi:predicted HicB family RNase H-like nuclease
MSKGKSNMESALENEIARGTGVSNELSPEDGPADKTILVRVTESDRERWKQAAEKAGKTMSQFIRDSVNESVKNTLDCPHPINMRRYYPWSEFCLLCQSRLK